MDFITKKINEKSKISSYTENYKEAVVQEQSRLEYVLILCLACVWNKNINKVDDETRTSCNKDIVTPSIGTIVSLIRKLDIDNEIFPPKKFKAFKESINEYPSIRNEKIGHGFSFEDDSKKLFNSLSKLYKVMCENGPDIISTSIDIIKVISIKDKVYNSIKFDANGESNPSTISKEVASLKKDYIYIKKDNQYIQVSPFIQIDNNLEDFYLFASIEDKLAERFLFNKLVTTGRKYFTIKDFLISTENLDEERMKSLNGTIINRYENNYKKYIESAIVKKVVKFLKTNQSTVFATLWGHGGVGKTAAIQRVCETLLSSSEKYYDYIIFMSAKDRKYNYFTGEIESLSNNIDTFESAIRFINKIVFEKSSFDIESIINFDGKMLIIFDDYETFSTEDKKSLIDFIKDLNILNHKVVITTRSASSITGEEIEVEELSSKESLEFFDSVLLNELELDNSIYLNSKKVDEFEEKLYKLTNGRPLFIYQSALIYGETNSLTKMLESNINESENAIDFLYGRIIEYLSKNAVKMFGAISLLTSINDLTNLISKLKYILNLEKNEDLFRESLEELAKLKIIKIIDNKYFRVYSSDIISIMSESLDNSGELVSRLQLVGRDKNMDSNLSLLKDADNSRILNKPTEVEQKYRHLISREATPSDIKMKAIINLGQYLIEDRGEYTKGLNLFREYQHIFDKEYIFIKAFSAYLWRGDNIEKKLAISLINNLLHSESFKSDIKIDLLTTLMTYETTYLITARDKLKDESAMGEISQINYELSYQEQKEEFYRIYNYPGLEIFKFVTDNTLLELKHELKIKIINSLGHFIEICLRRQKLDEIETIFRYVFNNLKYNYHDLFVKKLEKINRTKEDKKSYDSYIIEGSEGDRFKSNKNVLQKNKDSYNINNNLQNALIGLISN